MSDSKEIGELRFDKKDWFNWKNRPIPEYGQNRVRATVKEVTNIVPIFKKTREEWESWKDRPCDAGFLAGQEMVFMEGKKLVSGKIYCFSAIANTITSIWGMTYDAWFPWLHRVSNVSIKKADGTLEELKMLGYCPDMQDMVVFEIEKITGSEGKTGK